MRYIVTHTLGFNLFIDFEAKHYNMHQCALYIYRDHQTWQGRVECSKHTTETFWKKMKERGKI